MRLILNTLGDKECRPVYRAALQQFLRGLDLDEETRARIEINPLRVLDDKRPDVQAQLVGAPMIADYLCGECKAYHDEVRELLGVAGVEFTVVEVGDHSIRRVRLDLQPRATVGSQ